MASFRPADYRIRKRIGILGLTLPFMLWALNNGNLLSSISHYYYVTVPSLCFIIVLSSLALFLISYKGYEKDTGELINDNWVTNLAGLAALGVVLFPTSCDGSESTVIDGICSLGKTDTKRFPLLGHLNESTNTIHFICAAIFVFLMGYLSLFKFTRGDIKLSWKYKLYIISGALIWLSIALLGLYFLFELDLSYFVFWMETLAVVSFGISWIVKGETLQAVTNISRQVIKRFS